MSVYLRVRIDKQFLRTPFYGWPKMTAHLRRLGYAINGKRVMTVDASTDGHSSYLPQEKQQFSWQGAQALSLSVAQPADYACQPGLER